MPSSRAVELCNSEQTVTAALAKDPTRAVSAVRKGLFKRGAGGSRAKEKAKARDEGESELDVAARCGAFPERPSELFLKIYNETLQTLDSDPLSNMVSPPLIGSSGVIPLSIVSVIPDIMRHYADLIVRAETEVFLATNYWEPSHSSTIISDSIRELSKRVTARARAGGGGGGDEQKLKPVVFKLMYDRGNLQQLIKNHVPVPPSSFKSVGLPTPDEIPGVELQVVNYHRPMLGTFHAKYLVVDRRVACINSNNIQDRPNVEMMVHVEGPVVDSFYDMALLSWSNAMTPPLPLLAHKPKYDESYYKFDHENEYLKYIDQEATSRATREFLKKQHTLNDAETQIEMGHQPRRRSTFRLSSHGSFRLSGHGTFSGGGGGGDDEDALEDVEKQRGQFIAEHPNMMVPHLSGIIEEKGANGKAAINGGAGAKEREGEDAENGHASNGGEANGHAGEVTAEPDALGDVDAGDRPNPDGVKPDGTTEPDVGSSPPSADADAKPEDVAEPAGHEKGSAVADEQQLHEPDGHRKELTAAAVNERLNIGKVKLDATVDDTGVADFRPYIFHRPHAPCPIAMVNRKPTGAPGHRVKNPQDIAWLGALKYAQKSVFIQTPTFNAAPLIPATLDACRRDIEVTLYLDLGFNDQGEQIPFQGGTNEMVVHRMYTVLNKEKQGKEKNLKVYWYTGKDQKRPISAAAKKRNCHVKFMAVDDHIAIFGNGNQDTQSWFHSMEINLMVDSAPLVREWLDGLDANQNTRMFGLVSDVDGIWRDGDEVVQASGVRSATFLDWMRSVSGVFRRLRGSGGF